MLWKRLSEQQKAPAADPLGCGFCFALQAVLSRLDADAVDLADLVGQLKVIPPGNAQGASWECG